MARDGISMLVRLHKALASLLPLSLLSLSLISLKTVARSGFLKVSHILDFRSITLHFP